MATRTKSHPQPPPLHPLCLAVRKIRERSGESQDQFASRLKMGAMTISRFERGVAVPRDAVTLQKLASAAEAVELTAEAGQFAAAYTEAIGVEAVNRMYPGPREQALTMRFETLREWKAMAAALFGERYNAEPGSVRPIIEQIVRNADISRGASPDWYRELEARVKARMEEREQKLTGDEEER